MNLLTSLPSPRISTAIDSSISIPLAASHGRWPRLKYREQDERKDATHLPFILSPTFFSHDGDVGLSTSTLWQEHDVRDHVAIAQAENCFGRVQQSVNTPRVVNGVVSHDSDLKGGDVRPSGIPHFFERCKLSRRNQAQARWSGLGRPRGLRSRVSVVKKTRFVTS